MKLTEAEKQMQECFDQERTLLLKDIESMRLRLLRKDEGLNKIVHRYQQQQILLKSEIKDLEKINIAHEQKHLKLEQELHQANSLLEVSFDQHQEAQRQIRDLKTTLRLAKKHAKEEIAVANRELLHSLNMSEEERRTIRVNSERLRTKIKVLQEEHDKYKHEFAKKLQEEKSSLHVAQMSLKDEKARNLELCKRLDAAIDEANELKTSLRKFNHAAQEDRRLHMIECKEKADEYLTLESKHLVQTRQFSLAQEQLSMLEEDLVNTREDRRRVLEDYSSLRIKFQKAIAKRNHVSIGTNTASRSFHTSACQTGNDPEVEKLQLHVEDFQTKCLSMERELQEKVEYIEEIETREKHSKREIIHRRQQEEALQSIVATGTEKLDQLKLKFEKAQAMFKRASEKVAELEAKVANLTQSQTDQASRLAASEAKYNAQVRDLTQLSSKYKQSLSENKDYQTEITNLTRRNAECLNTIELLKKSTHLQWKEMEDAQINAERLIEEQAQTIQKLLEKQVNIVRELPATTQASRKPQEISESDRKYHILEKELKHLRQQMQQMASGTTVLSQNVSKGSTRLPQGQQPRELEMECLMLQEELKNATQCHQAQIEQCSLELDEREKQIQSYTQALVQEKEALLQRVREQALTIHELTVRESPDAAGIHRRLQVPLSPRSSEHGLSRSFTAR